jgi:hypothetical protein
MAQAFRLWVLNSKVRSTKDEMATEQVFLRVPSVFPTNHQSTVASLSVTTLGLRYKAQPVNTV